VRLYDIVFVKERIATGVSEGDQLRVTNVNVGSRNCRWPPGRFLCRSQPLIDGRIRNVAAVAARELQRRPHGQTAGAKETEMRLRQIIIMTIIISGRAVCA